MAHLKKVLIESTKIKGLERPSPITGAARLVDPLERMYSVEVITESEEDSKKRQNEAVKRDWENTGRYMRKALRQVGWEIKRAGESKQSTPDVVRKPAEKRERGYTG
ncbi:MAG: hypothetical protein ABI690_13450 [Chloroflexota bacterium]